MKRVLSIVIPVFNKWNFTKSCLKDLAQLPGDHEIVVIDNASSDETNKEIGPLFEELLDEHPDVRLYYGRNNKNTFHSEACNKGFRRSFGENILFLNNDIRVRGNHTSWTKPIIEACASTNGLVGPTMGLLDKDLNFVKETNQQLTGNC